MGGDAIGEVFDGDLIGLRWPSRKPLESPVIIEIVICWLTFDPLLMVFE